MLTPKAEDTVPEDAAYPKALREEEEKLLGVRRGATKEGPRKQPIGVALSGGGIRSAIFALGVFQAMAKAKKDLLSQVDYLSSVSGGGYFGGFYTAMFSRPDFRDFESVKRVLETESKPLRYLRRNGRYLAPAGTHDLILGASVLLRNWVTVIAMIASFLMTALLALEWLPLWAGAGYELNSPWKIANLDWARASALKHGIWLSEWFLPVVAIVALIALPLGWAYFTLGRPGLKTDGLWQLRAAVKPGVALSHAALVVLGLYLVRLGQIREGVVVIALALMVSASATGAEFWLVVWSHLKKGERKDEEPERKNGGQRDHARRWAATAIAFALGFVASTLPVAVVLGIASADDSWPFDSFVTVAALLWTLTMLVRGLASRMAKEGAELNAVDLDHFPRHTVSSWLKAWLVIAGVLLLLAVVQSAGRTLYAHLRYDVEWALGSLVAAIAPVATFAKKFVVKLGQRPDGKRSRDVKALLQYVAGAVVATALLVVASAGAASVTYGEEPPVPPLGAPPNMPVAQASSKEAATRAGTWMLALAGVSLLFGFSRTLLNNSTHLPLYAARITRTFLGASNSQRTGGLRDPVDVQHEAATHLMSDDDLSLSSYFRRDADGPFHKGAPLHLINVTINETVDGRSGMHEPDAKGLGLAVGPCGLSAGVRHHAVFAWDQESKPKVFPELSDFRVFDYSPAEARWSKKLTEWMEKVNLQRRSFPHEQLSVGQWLGVSGAAFTTGLGWRTNAGLSFLAGITNIRLGHWWKPGVWRCLTLTRVLGTLFWVQQYLAREFFARFPGTANTLWYLSDGGHFENTGAYELIRRKAEVILLVDAEADPAYEFEGLAHLVRKARIDFGASIEFLTRDDPRFLEYLPFKVLDCFGSLDELRRGHWKRDVTLVKNESEVLPRLDERGFTLDEVVPEALSRAHAAIAVIQYRDGSSGYLIYVKPTLTGSEPIDVARYHTEHPSFPQETTADQFFDEAQWESYRKLGEHIGGRVFAAGWPIDLDKSQRSVSSGPPANSDVSERLPTAV